jgi:penicillin amidase
LTGEVREAVEHFCGGVNRARSLALEENLPFEFELLEYEPAEWLPEDTLAVMRAFWWQLTGRFPIICLPELLRRSVGDGPLLEALLQPEGAQETIWPRGVPHPDLPRWEGEPSSGSHLADGAAPGSNNWVVGSSRSTTGAPLLASDPHVPIALPSVWYEACLRGGDLDAMGAMYVGVPGIFFGRNREVAWGLTNNISSLRDLYLEETDDFDPSRYRRPEGWKGVETRHETIQVRGSSPVEIEVREVDHGPIVSDVLPAFARNGETVSLRWVGREPTTELETMLGYARAASAAEFRAHLRGWSCPTFNWVMADRGGEIGYQLTGRLPLRPATERGYRSGYDPQHRWAGYVPFEALPACAEPPEGWLGSANNVVAVDWPYPLSGTWPSDCRMQRLVGFLNRPGAFSPADMEALQMDVLCPRAVEWAPHAVAALREAGVADFLLEELAAWDGAYPQESRPAAVFEAFFVQWARRTLQHRFPPELLTHLFPSSIGLVERLWVEDVAGWFGDPEARLTAVREAWGDALAWLEEQLGPERDGWSWGKVHTLTLRHPLGTTPLLRDLFERGPISHPGTWNTVNNSLYDIDRPFDQISGVSYRLLVDFAGSTLGSTPGGQSGHPGSAHYVDQVPGWVAGEYHRLDRDPETSEGWTIRSGEHDSQH